jgi:hypothetical protein
VGVLALVPPQMLGHGFEELAFMQSGTSSMNALTSGYARPVPLYCLGDGKEDAVGAACIACVRRNN